MWQGGRAIRGRSSGFQADNTIRLYTVYVGVWCMCMVIVCHESYTCSTSQCIYIQIVCYICCVRCIMSIQCQNYIYTYILYIYYRTHTHTYTYIRIYALNIHTYPRASPLFAVYTPSAGPRPARCSRCAWCRRRLRSGATVSEVYMIDICQVMIGMICIPAYDTYTTNIILLYTHHTRLTYTTYTYTHIHTSQYTVPGSHTPVPSLPPPCVSDLSRPRRHGCRYRPRCEYLYTRAY